MFCPELELELGFVARHSSIHIQGGNYGQSVIRYLAYQDERMGFVCFSESD